MLRLAGPRNALGHRPEPEVLPLPAETSREAPKCCAWQGGGPKPSAAPGSIKGGGGPRNALGYRPEPEVLPLPAETSREAPKCCAWQHQGGGPRNALGYRPEPEVLPLPAETSREAPKGGGPETRSGTVQSLKCCLPAETSREAPKCCAWQHQGGGPRNALGHRPEPEVLPLPAETSREAPKCVSSVKRARAPSERVCVYCVCV